MIFKPVIYMPGYCKECGYKCCGPGCYNNGCDKSIICETWPLTFINKELGYRGPFGLLGYKGWSINDKCAGLKIITEKDSLETILQRFVKKISCDCYAFELSDQGVYLKMKPVSKNEIDDYNINKLWNLFAQNFL